MQAISEAAGCSVYSFNTGTSKRNSKFKKSYSTRISDSSNKSQPSVGDKESGFSSGIVAEEAVLSVVGRYDKIINLVEKLQNRSQKVWIDPFKMEILELENGHLKCDITITFYKIEDREAMVHG